jgi:flagellar biogenesis protein FliO
VRPRLVPALLTAFSLTLAVATAQQSEPAQEPPPSSPQAPATPSHAASDPRSTRGPSAESHNLQFALYLAALLGLFAGGAYLIRNGFTVFQPRPKGDRKLIISETRVLGNRQFLIVAEYESRKMLLGVCPGRIDYLCTLAEPEREFPQIGPEKIDA